MHYSRLVIKFGTNLLTAGTDHLDTKAMTELIQQVAHLHQKGREIVVVSSGAIAAGRQKIKKIPENKNTPFRQVLDNHSTSAAYQSGYFQSLRLSQRT